MYVVTATGSSTELTGCTSTMTHPQDVLVQDNMNIPVKGDTYTLYSTSRSMSFQGNVDTKYHNIQ
jgi:hypothetical protein